MNRARHWMAPLLIAAAACAGPQSADSKQYAEAQKIVDSTVAEHANVVRLTIHGVPQGETKMRVIASNVDSKLGKDSDPEDVEAMKTLKPVVLEEGEALDVTLPLLDDAGRAIGATGVTLKPAPGASREQTVAAAQSIARDVSAAIRATGRPLW